MICSEVFPASARKRRAAASAAMPWTRSSVERMTRETSEVTMMVPMNQDAILTPSGRSMMLAMVV